MKCAEAAGDHALARELDRDYDYAGVDTCAVDGCERPFAWCEIHHPHWWSHGGHTTLDNGLPLCGYHHQRAHDDRFDLRHHPSGE